MSTKEDNTNEDSEEINADEHVDPSMAKAKFEEWKSAIQSGNVPEVGRLLEQHPEIVKRINEQCFSFGSSAVFECRRNVEMIDLLLQHGADLNQKTDWWAGGFGILEGVSSEVGIPLVNRGAQVDIWGAVSLNRVDWVKELLAENPAQVCSGGGDGKHPLHYAQSIEMVDLLVQAGANVDGLDVDHTSTPIQYLIGNESLVRQLLEHGAKPDVFAAAALGDIELLDRCLESEPDEANARLGVGRWANRAGGVIYNWTLGHGLTPLDVARSRNHQSVLKRLLLKCSKERQLTDALWHGDLQRVDATIESDESLLENLSSDAKQLLARAAWEFRSEAVEKMLQLGFNAHVTGAHNSTPLDRAAFHGYVDIVKLLLEYDTTPPLEFKNEFGGTPLGACLFGFRNGWDTGNPRDHFATLKLLLDAGAQPPKEFESTGDQRIDSLFD